MRHLKNPFIKIEYQCMHRNSLWDLGTYAKTRCIAG